MSLKQYSLENIANILGADLRGDGGVIITGIAPLDKAKAGQISFLHNSRYSQFLTVTQASAVVLQSDFAASCATNALVVSNPYLCFAQLAELFNPYQLPLPGIHSTAVISKSAKLGSSVSIGPHVVIEDGAYVGDETVIEASTVIGKNVVIGKQCHFYPNVTLYHDVKVGNHVTIHSGAVIGSDGFGLANDAGIWRKIPQIGSVEIGNHVEIGSNTSIDRGALENTVIEEGVKIDNLVQIAHNVRIGAHTAIAGCAGIAGSTKIGKHCMIGGAAIINGHIEITDGVILTGNCAVDKSITEKGVYSSGLLVQKNSDWKKSVIRFRQLESLFQRLKILEKESGTD